MDDFVFPKHPTVESPLVRQFLELRKEATAVLAFQVGVFFEFYFDDARVVSEVCDISLGKRGAVPMAAFPADARFAALGANQVQFLGSSTPYFEMIASAGFSVAVATEVGMVEGKVERRISGRIAGHASPQGYHLTPLRTFLSKGSNDTF